MADFEERYYKYIKQCLTLCGLWFNNKVYHSRLTHLVWYIINLSLIIPQMVILVKEYKNLNILMENIVLVMFFTGGCIKFSIAVFSSNEMKALYSKITSDWKDITNTAERAILERYNKDGLWLSKLYMIFIIVIWIVCSSKPFLPLIVDLIMPLENATRSLGVPLYSDYIFFNQTDYLYWVSAYTAASYTFFLPFFSGFDSFYLLTVKHTCGLFAVTRYRIKTTLNGDVNENEASKSLLKRTIYWKNLKDAVKLHNESMRSVELLEDSFNICFLSIISLCTCGLAVAATYTIHILNDFYALLRMVVLESGIVIHLFFMTWIGQQLIDDSEQVFYSAYFSNWYTKSSVTRKYIHIIMMHSYYPSKLTAGKLVDLSMETFGVIMKNVVSYFTVFLSLT